MKANKIALGVLGGIAAGAALGILFAPAKGADTRKKIQQKGNDCADDLKNKLDNISDVLKDNYEKMFQDGKNRFADGKSKFDAVKNEIKNASV
jgi:gas vesicle protein